jgi:hypothetical protein
MTSASSAQLVPTRESINLISQLRSLAAILARQAAREDVEAVRADHAEGA